MLDVDLKPRDVRLRAVAYGSWLNKAPIGKTDQYSSHYDTGECAVHLSTVGYVPLVDTRSSDGGNIGKPVPWRTPDVRPRCDILVDTSPSLAFLQDHHEAREGEGACTLLEKLYQVKYHPIRKTEILSFYHFGYLAQSI